MLSKIAQEIFHILKGYGKKLALYDIAGNKIYKPELTQKFFVEPDNFMVALNDDGSDSNITLNLSKKIDITDQNLSMIMDTLRNLATRYNLLFNVRKYSKKIIPKDFAYQASPVTEGKNTMSNPSSNSIRHKIGEMTIIVNNVKSLNESEGNTIKTIYLEDKNGNKVLYPYPHIIGAKALAEHINHGGSLSDSIGNYITDLSRKATIIKKIPYSINESKTSSKMSEKLRDLAHEWLLSLHGESDMTWDEFIIDMYNTFEPYKYNMNSGLIRSCFNDTAAWAEDAKVNQQALEDAIVDYTEELYNKIDKKSINESKTPTMTKLSSYMDNWINKNVTHNLKAIIAAKHDIIKKVENNTFYTDEHLLGYFGEELHNNTIWKSKQKDDKEWLNITRFLNKIRHMVSELTVTNSSGTVSKTDISTAVTEGLKDITKTLNHVMRNYETFKESFTNMIVESQNNIPDWCNIIAKNDEALKEGLSYISKYIKQPTIVEYADDKNDTPKKYSDPYMEYATQWLEKKGSEYGNKDIEQLVNSLKMIATNKINYEPTLPAKVKFSTPEDEYRIKLMQWLDPKYKISSVLFTYINYLTDKLSDNKKLTANEKFFADKLESKVKIMDEDVIKIKEWYDQFDPAGLETVGKQIDALSDIFEPGDTEIWYSKKVNNFNDKVTPDTIDSTHVLLGTVIDTNLDDIMYKMTTWDDGNDVKPLLKKKKITHSTLSVGDVIHTPEGWFMVDVHGYVNIENGDKISESLGDDESDLKNQIKYTSSKSKETRNIEKHKNNIQAMKGKGIMESANPYKPEEYKGVFNIDADDSDTLNEYKNENTITRDDSDAKIELRKNKKIQDFLNIKMINRALRTSGVINELDTDYADTVFSVVEGAYLFSRDFDVDWGRIFNGMRYNPAADIKSYGDLDEIGQIIYDELEASMNNYSAKVTEGKSFKRNELDWDEDRNDMITKKDHRYGKKDRKEEILSKYDSKGSELEEGKTFKLSDDDFDDDEKTKKDRIRKNQANHPSNAKQKQIDDAIYDELKRKAGIN